MNTFVSNSMVFILTIALSSCSTKNIEQFVHLNTLPVIKPDYTDLTIPPNIAPLNFNIEEEGEKFFVKIYSENGYEISVSSRNSGIRIPLRQWKKLLKQNIGSALNIDIYAKRKEGWFKYNTISNQIAKHKIDKYIVYRLLYPQFYIKNRMDIFQRDMETFSKKRIITQKEGCFNCHTFFNHRTDKYLTQARIYGKNYLLINDNDKISLITPRLRRPGSAYLSWHPSGDLFALSTDMGVYVWNFIAGRGAEEVLEYTDMDADMSIYHLSTNTVSTTRAIAQKDRMETHPAWSPDGKYLYFLSAPRVRKEDFEKVKYDLVRIGYDNDNNEWGELETIISSKETGLGCTFPRFSPDGKYLLFCMTDRGSFSILRQSTDVYLMDMETGKYRRLDINSDRTDSYHAWTSNSRWISLISKRDDAIFGKVYFSYVDSSGIVYKPFLLPQEDPYFYNTFVKTYHRAEFINEPVKTNLTYLNKIISDTSLIEIANVDSKIDAITNATPKVSAENLAAPVAKVSDLKIQLTKADELFKNGIAFYKDKQTDRALQIFKDVIEINPYHTRSHYILSLYYAKQENFELAIEHCDKAIDSGAKFPDQYLQALESHRK